MSLQTELIRLGARFLIAGSDVTYLMEAAKADSRKFDALKADLKENKS